jgi:alpha-L-fucosidase 2
VVDIDWKDGSLVAAKVKSTVGGVCRIKSLKPVVVREAEKSVPTSEQGGILSFDSTNGGVYEILPSGA